MIIALDIFYVILPFLNPIEIGKLSQCTRDLQDICKQRLSLQGYMEKCCMKRWYKSMIYVSWYTECKKEYINCIKLLIKDDKIELIKPLVCTLGKSYKMELIFYCIKMSNNLDILKFLVEHMKLYSYSDWTLVYQYRQCVNMCIKRGKEKFLEYFLQLDVNISNVYMKYSTSWRIFRLLFKHRTFNFQMNLQYIQHLVRLSSVTDDDLIEIIKSNLKYINLMISSCSHRFVNNLYLISSLYHHIDYELIKNCIVVLTNNIDVIELFSSKVDISTLNHLFDNRKIDNIRNILSFREDLKGNSEFIRLARLYRCDSLL